MAASLCSSQVINNKLIEILRRRVCLNHVNHYSYTNYRTLFNLRGCQDPYKNIPSKDRYSNVDVFWLGVDNGQTDKFVIRKNCNQHLQVKTWNLSNHIVHSGNYVYSKDRGRKDVSKSQKRWNSSGKPPRSLPPLMNHPEIVWPSVLKTLKNRILSTFIITPYFDKEFRLAEFIRGSKQAVQCVSSYLSRGDYDGLEGLLTADSLREVKKNVATFSVEQRHELFVNKEDIYFTFPYQIGIMFNEDDSNQQRFVEITMVYHTLRGLKEMRANDITPPLNLGMLPEYQDKLQLCNYRFIREFTKGVESDWTVNVVNHFKPVDQMKT